MHRLAVVILNYRTPDLVLDCLASLASEVGPDDAVVVVDNRSADGSVRRIQAGIAARGLEQVTLVESPVNGGFSAGNNYGIRAVAARAYLLLNSDTVVRPGAVERLCATLEAEPHVGLVSPRLLAPDGTPQVNCFRRHTPVSELLHAARTGPVDRALAGWRVPMAEEPAGLEPEWTSFAAVLIRREVIEQVGLLDEGFFMYYEDVDYCLRARAAGWAIRHEPRAQVVHFHGVSSKIEELTAARRRRPPYYYQARARYFRKTLGPGGPLLANALWLVGRGIAWAREVVGNKQPHAVEREALDIWRG
jgi:N-acetylglucosaminyl-diphospho-decaprenol L-rhamnosyltransferase